MYNLRLIKGKSYFGIVYATEKSPLVNVAEKEKADYLVESGYFELIGNSENLEPETVPNNVDTPEDSGELFSEDVDETEENSVSEVMELQRKTKAELIDYAAKKGIDVVGCKTKDEIFSKIVEAMANADEARTAIRE